MNKYLLAISLFIMMSCGDKSTSPLDNTVVNVTDFKGFELELNTWSPDRIMDYSTGGGSLIIYFQTSRYSQNKSNSTFEVNQHLHRGAILYQYINDTLKIVGLGKGTIVDNFNKTIEVVYPNEIYRYISRIDSVEFLDIVATIYYSNYWYMGEFNPDKIFNKDIGKIFGKRIDMDGE